MVRTLSDPMPGFVVRSSFLGQISLREATMASCPLLIEFGVAYTLSA